MKSVVLFLAILAASLTSGGVSAATLKNHFVREAGECSLDDNGSTLTITPEPAGWSLKVTWRSGTGATSAAPDNCLRAKGWFVFIERPERIWVYDGLESGILLTHSAKQDGVWAFSPTVMASCPQKVFDALPPSVRKHYGKVGHKDGAAGSPPILPEANRTPSAAGSRR